MNTLKKYCHLFRIAAGEKNYVQQTFSLLTQKKMKRLFSYESTNESFLGLRIDILNYRAKRNLKSLIAHIFITLRIFLRLLTSVASGEKKLKRMENYLRLSV